MAKFTKAQVRSAEVLSVSRWHRKGGWEPYNNYTDIVEDILHSSEIYYTEILIDGVVRHGYSRGAKEYGLENLE